MSILCIFFITCFQTSLPLEQPHEDSSAVAKIVFTQDLSELSSQDLADALAELRERTKQLELELKDADLNASTDQKMDEDSDWLDDGNLNESSEEFGEFAEIQRNIKLLQELYEEKNRRQLEAAQKSVESPKEQDQVKLPEIRSDGTIVETVNSDDKGPATSSVQMPALPKLPKPVVSRIVDPFELGNSLFMRASFDEAMKFYEMVPADQLSNFDRNWLELMKGCCYRMLGQIDEAEVAFRNVAGSKSNPNTSEIAKGWLQYLRSQKRMVNLAEDYTKNAELALQKANELLEEANGKTD